MVDKQEKNQVKIGFKTRIGNVVKYSISLFKEENFRTIHFSAIGGAIGSLVNVVEVLKTLHPGLYQVNKISSVSHQTLDSTNKEIIKERLSPKMDTTLTFDKPNQTGEGFQEPYSEEIRTKLADKLNEKRDKPRDDREDRDERRPFRGGRGFQQRGRGFGGRGRGFGGRNDRGDRRDYREGGERREFREGGERREFRGRGDRRDYREGGDRREFREGGDRREFREGGDRREFREGGERREFRGRGFTSGGRGESRGRGFSSRGFSRGGFRGDSRGPRGNQSRGAYRG
jgi:DNA-binding protein